MNGDAQVEREIINHSCLIHPHIVRFRECFLTPKYLGIAMEYAAGGDLYKFVAAKYPPLSTLYSCSPRNDTFLTVMTF